MAEPHDSGRRLKPVAHPRLWLALAIAAYALGIGAWSWTVFADAVDPKDRLIAIWAIGVPASLIGVWLVSVWSRHMRRAARTRRGRCAFCNYDLTGNLSGVCPECGTARTAG